MPPKGPRTGIEARIQSSKDRKPHFHRGHIQRDKRTPHLITALLCKGCGAKIAGWIPSETHPDRMIYAALAGYMDVLIEFEDGTKHSTPMCQECAAKVTNDDLEDIYAADLAAFMEEERLGRGSVPWHVMGLRKPKRLVKEG